MEMSKLLCCTSLPPLGSPNTSFGIILHSLRMSWLSNTSNVSEDWTIGSFFISTFPESNVESTSLAFSKGGTEQRYRISALTENELLIIRWIQI